MLIPEVRVLLLLTMDELVKGNLTPVQAARHVRLLNRELWRRPRVRRARDTYKPPSPMDKVAIRRMAHANPDMTMHDIGLHFGVTAGRVSEAIAGKRI